MNLKDPPAGVLDRGLPEASHDEPAMAATMALPFLATRRPAVPTAAMRRRGINRRSGSSSDAAGRT